MSLLLRGWIATVATAAVGNSIACFLNDGYPHERIYSITDQVTPLTTRIYAIWTLLAAAIRYAYVASPHDQSLRGATLASFGIAFVHFSSEVFIYRTAPLCFGTVSPLIVSGVSMLWLTNEMLKA